MVCQNCGADNREQAKYCARCGTKMKKDIVLTETKPQSQSVPANETVTGSVLEHAFSEKAVEANRPALKNGHQPKHARKHASLAAKAELDRVMAQLQTPVHAEKPAKSSKGKQADVKQQKPIGPAPQAVFEVQPRQTLPVADKKLTGVCVQCGNAISQTTMFCMRCGATQPGWQAGNKSPQTKPAVTDTSVSKQLPQKGEQEKLSVDASTVVSTVSGMAAAKQKPTKQPKAVKPKKTEPAATASNAKQQRSGGLCAVCQTPIPKQTAYCVKCGTPLSKAIVPPQKSRKAWVWVACIAAAIVFIAGGATVLTNNNAVQYQTAINAMTDGNYGAAYQTFSRLGSYESAEMYSDYCEAQILFEAGKYAQAKTLFTDVQAHGDAADMALPCRQYINYINAGELLAQDKNYEAFAAYHALGDFLDSAARKLGCVLDTPKSGTLYQNSDYAGADVALRIQNPNFEDAYLKIYDGDILVAAVFIRSEDVAVITFKSGDYHMNKALGLQWFGEHDLFGDDGYYAKVVFDEVGSDHYPFEAGSEGTLTIVADIGTENKDIDRTAC